jgi:hypothetical protein
LDLRTGIRVEHHVLHIHTKPMRFISHHILRGCNYPLLYSM